METDIANEPVLPKGIPPELVPLYDWWVKEGKSTLVMVVVAVACVFGWRFATSYFAKRDAAANAALVNANGVAELQDAVQNHGSTKVGPALKLRYARALYDAGRYQEALDLYEALIAKNYDGFHDIALVGKAFALEGLKKYDEANKAFADYANDEDNKDSFLLLTAQMGAARTQALKGDKEAGVKALEALKGKATDEMDKVEIDRMIDTVKRFDPSREAASLFDIANDAEKQLEKEEKGEEAKSAAPASVAKPAAKPAAPAAPAAPAPAKK